MRFDMANLWVTETVNQDGSRIERNPFTRATRMVSADPLGANPVTPVDPPPTPTPTDPNAVPVVGAVPAVDSSGVRQPLPGLPSANLTTGMFGFASQEGGVIWTNAEGLIDTAAGETVTWSATGLNPSGVTINAAYMPGDGAPVTVLTGLRGVININTGTESTTISASQRFADVTMTVKDSTGAVITAKTRTARVHWMGMTYGGGSGWHSQITIAEGSKSRFWPVIWHEPVTATLVTFQRNISAQPRHFANRSVSLINGVTDVEWTTAHHGGDQNMILVHSWYLDIPEHVRADGTTQLRQRVWCLEQSTTLLGKLEGQAPAGPVHRGQKFADPGQPGPYCWVFCDAQALPLWRAGDWSHTYNGKTYTAPPREWIEKRVILHLWGPGRDVAYAYVNGAYPVGSLALPATAAAAARTVTSVGTWSKRPSINSDTYTATYAVAGPDEAPQDSRVSYIRRRNWTKDLPGTTDVAKTHTRSVPVPKSLVTSVGTDGMGATYNPARDTYWDGWKTHWESNPDGTQGLAAEEQGCERNLASGDARFDILRPGFGAGGTSCSKTTATITHLVMADMERVLQVCRWNAANPTRKMSYRNTIPHALYAGFDALLNSWSIFNAAGGATAHLYPAQWLDGSVGPDEYAMHEGYAFRFPAELNPDLWPERVNGAAETASAWASPLIKAIAWAIRDYGVWDSDSLSQVAFGLGLEHYVPYLVRDGEDPRLTLTDYWGKGGSQNLTLSKYMPWDTMELVKANAMAGDVVPIGRTNEPPTWDASTEIVHVGSVRASTSATEPLPASTTDRAAWSASLPALASPAAVRHSTVIWDVANPTDRRYRFHEVYRAEITLTPTLGAAATTDGESTELWWLVEDAGLTRHPVALTVEDGHWWLVGSIGAGWPSTLPALQKSLASLLLN